MTFFLVINFLADLVVNHIHISLIVCNLIFISIFHYLVIIILLNCGWFSLLFFLFASLTVICPSIVSVLSLFDRKLMEKLLLILKLSIFVYPHCCIWRRCGNHFKKWMHSYPLDKFLMSFQCLKFSLFVGRYLPKYGSAIQRATNKKRWITGPRQIHDITNMSPHLPRLAPLNHLLQFSKLHRHWFELPQYNHLVVTSTCQELSVWGKSNAIHSFLMASRQIIQILRLCFKMMLIRLLISWALASTAVYLVVFLY